MTTTTNKNWQQIAKERNLDISVVEVCDLEEFKRIDPEYYRPEYLIPKRKGLEFEPIGNFLTCCEYGLSQAMNEEGIGEKIFRMNDLVDSFAINDNLKYTDIDENCFKKYQVRKNDILFNRVNSIDFVGRTGIFKSSNEDSIFASYLVRLKVDESRIKPDYLNLFLNSRYGKKEIFRKARRAVNQANVNAEELKRIKLPIMRYDLQEKLESLSDKSFQELEKSKILYQKAENILFEALDLKNWQPSEKNWSIKELDEVKLFGRIDGEFFQPKYDEIEKKIKNYQGGFDTLENLINISNKTIRPISENDYQYCELSNIDSSLGLINEFQTIKGKDLPSRAKMKIKKNDIVVSSVAGSSEKIAFVLDESDNLVASTGFFVLQKKYLTEEVILVLMKSWFMQEFLKRSARGMILSATIKEDFKNYIIPKILPDVQKEISCKIKESYDAKNKSKKLLEKAKKTVEIFIETDEKTAIEFLQKE